MITIVFTYFSKHYYHASFQELNPSVVSVAAASSVRPSAILLLLIVVIDKNSLAVEVFCDVKINHTKLHYKSQVVEMLQCKTHQEALAW
jgi:hypothetical protein